jgi:hypothetical protein
LADVLDASDGHGRWEKTGDFRKLNNQPPNIKLRRGSINILKKSGVYDVLQKSPPGTP